MEDRLAELQQLAGPVPQIAGDKAGNEFMPEFVSKTRAAQGLLEKVKVNNDQLAKLRDAHRNATQSDQEKKISDLALKTMDESNAYNNKVKDILKELGDDIEKSKKTAPDEPETRMKQNIHGSLSSKFKEVLNASQAMQTEMEQSAKKKMARQVKLVNDKLSDEEIKELCNDPEAVQKMISEKMMGGAHAKLQNAVSDIQDKYRDIQRLEASIELVFKMFQDLALLVHQQGEMLDSIEENITATKDYVEKAEKKLIKGKEENESAQKKKCFLAICGICVVIVMVGIPAKFFLF